MEKFTRPELDPEKIALFGPPVTGDELPRDESGYIDTISFSITEEKSILIFELFRKITLNPYLNRLNGKQ